MLKKFSLPGYYAFYDRVLNLLDYRKTHELYFYEDRIIDSSYDFPTQLIWNGGRVTNVYYEPTKEQEIMSALFQYPNLQLRHTCTNVLITEELTRDWKCNLFLQTYGRLNDAVIVNSDALFKYIQTTYPQFQLIYSTTKNITDIDEMNEKSKDHIVVLNYNFNNNNYYLKDLIHPENIEIICAEPCIMNCPNRLNHYYSIGRKQLGYPYDRNDLKILTDCPNGCEALPFYRIQQRPTAITNERIEELSNMGFQYFKISGRTLNMIQWFEIVCYYLIKPEYYEIARQDLIGGYFLYE